MTAEKSVANVQSHLMGGGGQWCLRTAGLLEVWLVLSRMEGLFQQKELGEGVTLIAKHPATWRGTLLWDVFTV